MSAAELKHVVEAALFAAGRPLTLDDMLGLFTAGDLRPDRAAVRAVLSELSDDWAERGIELVEVASGHRFQVRKELGAWMAPLWAERPPRYSRALLETLALIAYRQPITRAEIEEVRGVSVSSSIVKTLVERDWIRVLGHREVPGRPALYGTTREFLDAFGLKKLDDLPPLSELTDLDQMGEDLFSSLPGTADGIAQETDQHTDQGTDLGTGDGAVPAEGAPEEVSDLGVPAQAVAGIASTTGPGSAAGPAPESPSDDASAVVSAGDGAPEEDDDPGRPGGPGP